MTVPEPICSFCPLYVCNSTPDHHGGRDLRRPELEDHALATFAHRSVVCTRTRAGRHSSQHLTRNDTKLRPASVSDKRPHASAMLRPARQMVNRTLSSSP
eukprot:4747851-Amphidinium_carterae.1